MHSIPSVAGAILFSNGDRYTGEIKEGYLHGQGEYTFADGSVYKGAFYYSNMTGECSIAYP